ncbi:uncharacterized protein N7459_006614 [Penicillium hispanicum]|uniref:uncharacterized protein n=1 Tax=Penicillium hispanicum TaxID=1080232 RepID=UPI00253F94E4|nr:uncharacterized protein N7459_006614 [Penicillium hispanicum]KAJ5577650.1 hypothetical protein N7459_006614 [Penicillium hispanicum]
MWLDIPRSALVMTGITTVLASQDLLPRAAAVSTPATGFSTIRSQASVTPSSSAKAGASGSLGSKSAKASSTGTGTTTASVAMASPWKKYVSMDGEQYRIPAGDSTIDLILDDGALLTLKSGSISIDGHTVSIPADLSHSPLLDTDGKSLTAGEGFDGSDSSGISSSISALSKLKKTESSLARGLNAIVDDIFNWCSGPPQYTLGLSALPTIVDSAVDDMSKLLSPMRSLVQKPSVELQEIKPEGLRVISDAYPDAERIYDILSSMQKTLKALPKASEKVIIRVQQQWVHDVGLGSTMATFGSSKLEPVWKYNWDDAIKNSTRRATA